MKMQNSALEMGAILRAWLPFDETPNVAGPKFRPVIFLGETEVNGETHWVVVFGTTQMRGSQEAKNGGDLIIRCMEDRAVVLNTDTRFDFNRIQSLPATTEFFSANKAAPVAKVVNIPEQYLEQAARCMHQAKVGQKLSRMGIRC